MPIHRIIFRIDFAKPNYDLLNTPGTVLKLMSDMGEKFWDEYQDAPQTRTVSATRSEKDRLHYQMAVEPAQVNFEIEQAVGVPAEKLDESALLSTLLKGVHTICESYKVVGLLRSGLRVFHWSTLGQGAPNLGGAFRRSLDPNVQATIEANIGAIADWGLSFDGTGADQIKYHLRFGPYSADESRKYLPRLHKSLSKDYNFVLDLDLYEENFALKGGRPSQWVVPLHLRMQKLLKELEGNVVSNI